MRKAWVRQWGDREPRPPRVRDIPRRGGPRSSGQAISTSAAVAAVATVVVTACRTFGDEFTAPAASGHVYGSVAVVVDPQRDIDWVLALAAARGSASPTCSRGTCTTTT
jgi:hypothetical protein